MTDEKPPTDPAAKTEGPPSVEAMVSAADLDDLFRDLAACVELQHIAVKYTADRANAHPAPLDLVKARLLLNAPDIHALQLRYAYNGNLWIDTLSPRDDGYHLLRIRHA